MNRCSIFFVKFVNVFVHPSANQNSRLRSIFLQGFKSDFNSIWKQRVRHLDFQYWANVHVSSDPSHRNSTFIISRLCVRVCSACSNTSANTNDKIMDCHETVSTRNLSREASRFASLNYSQVLWKRFESLAMTSQLVSLCRNVGRRGAFLTNDKTSGESRQSNSSFIFASGFSVLENKSDLRSVELVLRTNPRSLRRH